MSLSSYKQLLLIFPEKPDLISLKVGEMFPEAWPVLLKNITGLTNGNVEFEITDSKHALYCITGSPDSISKLKDLSSGHIVFLYNSVLSLKNTGKGIMVNVDLVYTLKEVNDGLAKPRKAEEMINLEAKESRKISRASSRLSLQAKDKQEKESGRWRTLAERWKIQGKI
jgi:hypothetical protein